MREEGNVEGEKEICCRKRGPDLDPPTEKKTNTI